VVSRLQKLFMMGRNAMQDQSRNLEGSSSNDQQVREFASRANPLLGDGDCDSSRTMQRSDVGVLRSDGNPFGERREGSISTYAFFEQRAYG
jgi:hypothetical protein